MNDQPPENECTTSSDLVSENLKTMNEVMPSLLKNIEVQAASSANRPDKASANDVLKQRIQQRFDELVASAGRRYANKRLTNFIATTIDQKKVLERCRCYCAEMDDRIRAGEGLVMMGKVGTGKDHLAFAIARHVISRGGTVAWVDGLAWHCRMRDRIDDERGRSEAAEISQLAKPTVLVLSDPLPPVGELSAFQAANLLHVVNRRYINCKPTIVTVNIASEADAPEFLGPQAWDRLRQGAELLEFRGESFRQRRVG